MINDKKKALYINPKETKRKLLILMISTIILVLVIDLLFLLRVNLESQILSLLVVDLLIIIISCSFFISRYGHDFEIYHDMIIIYPRWFEKGVFKKEPIRIKCSDIQYILYLNKMIHFYIKKPDDKIVRHWIDMGILNKKRVNNVLNILSQSGSNPKWKGPTIRNINDRIQEKKSFKMGALLFFSLLSIISLLIVVPFTFFVNVGDGSLDNIIFFLIAFSLTFTIPLMIVLFPFFIMNRKTYVLHDRNISIEGGFLFSKYTEYNVDEIEKIERRVIHPFWYFINLGISKYFMNNYSSKLHRDVYLIKFDENYKIFEKGEYVSIKHMGSSTFSKYQHIAIPRHIIEEISKRGVNIV